MKVNEKVIFLKDWNKYLSEIEIVSQISKLKVKTKKEEVELGVVYYWSDGGWHGTVLVVRKSNRYVYYIVDYKSEKKQRIFKELLSEFIKKYHCDSSKRTGEGWEYIHDDIGSKIKIPEYVR